MIGAVARVREPVTTSGTIALVNLHAQIGGAAARTHDAAELIDLLILRGHVLFSRDSQLLSVMVLPRDDRRAERWVS
jgi:hypothetical protein